MTTSDQPASGLSRRSFMKYSSAGAASAAAVAALPGSANAAHTTQALKEQFLIDRLTFGRTPEMATEMRNRGYMGFLDWQLQMPGEQLIDDSELFALPNPATGFLGGPVYLENPDPAELWGLSVYDIAVNPKFGPWPQGANTTIGQSPQIVMLAGQYATHQLRWVMTDFLQNVHNTYILQPLMYLAWAPMLHDVIHEHALGMYPTLLDQSSKSAGMLTYLGQFASDALNANENYARELMELHSIGVKNHLGIRTFTEMDVAEAAKILTGWDYQTGGISLGDFLFNPSKHAGGDKFIGLFKDPVTLMPPKAYPGPLGTAGQPEGETFMADLAAHPLTALNITYRMIQWFLGDDVETTYRNAWIRTATKFFTSGGNLQLTVRELFDEAHFGEIFPGRYEKIRRPLNLTVAVKRLTGAKIDFAGSNDLWKWFAQNYQMGQLSGAWAAPNGHQPQNAKWTSTVLARMEFLHDIFFGDNGLTIDDATLESFLPTSIHLSNWANVVNNKVFGGCLSQADVAQISSQLSLSQGNDAQRRREAFFLAFAAPSYQYFC